MNLFSPVSGRMVVGKSHISHVPKFQPDLKTIPENLPYTRSMPVFLSPVQALVLFLLLYYDNGSEKRNCNKHKGGTS
jgi:hypothetical protein